MPGSQTGERAYEEDETIEVILHHPTARRHASHEKVSETSYLIESEPLDLLIPGVAS